MCRLWGQKNLSKTIVGIRPTRARNPTTNVFTTGSQRQVNGFAVLAKRNEANVDPSNLAQSQFYVLPTSVLNERELVQKTIGLFFAFIRL